jgi:hypothetical protein
MMVDNKIHISTAASSYSEEHTSLIAMLSQYVFNMNHQSYLNFLVHHLLQLISYSPHLITSSSAADFSSHH